LHIQKEQEEILDAKQPKSAPVTPKRPPPGNSKPTKRALADVSHTVRKRQKTSTTSESEGELSTPPSDESEGEQEVQRAPKGSASRSGIPSKLPKGNEKKSSFSKDDLSDLSDVLEELEKPVKVTPGKTDPRRSESSESETSVLIDEGPKRKKQKVPEMAQTKRRKQHNKTKSDANLDQDQVEIKRLQGWLVKCGIRKMWFRELAPYNSPKAKIKHLKDMLKDAGMEGRYSIEKAKLIREERELRADLEMVQEGAKRWGTAKTDEDKDAPKKPRRGLARGFKNFDFLGDDGEETD